MKEVKNTLNIYPKDHKERVPIYKYVGSKYFGCNLQINVNPSFKPGNWLIKFKLNLLIYGRVIVSFQNTFRKTNVIWLNLPASPKPGL